MKLLYVAGKYRGNVSTNVAVATRVGEKILLRYHGQVFPVIPHLLGQALEHCSEDDGMWLGATLEILRRCDGILMLPGWEESQGARGERDEALRLNIPIFYFLEDVRSLVEPSGGLRP